MTQMKWRRVGKASGQCNVLNDRYEIVKVGTKWVVVDHAPKAAPRKVIACRTMGEARRQAVLIARYPEEYAPRRGGDAIATQTTKPDHGFTRMALVGVLRDELEKVPAFTIEDLLGNDDAMVNLAQAILSAPLAYVRVVSTQPLFADTSADGDVTDGDRAEDG